MSAGTSILKPRRSLRRKLMLIVLAATMVALFVSAIALLLYEVYAFRKDGISDLGSQADLVAQSVAPALAFDDPRAAREALAALKLRPHIRAAAVYSSGGSLFASAPLAAAEVPPALAAARGLPEPAAARAHFDGGELTLVRPIVLDQENLGSVYLRAQYDLTGRLVSQLWIIALASIAGLGLAALTFRRLHPQVIGPILEVAEAARRLMEERRYDAGLRIQKKTDDEVGMLVDAFNGMVHDISAEMQERHSAEQALKAADVRKDEFLATLAHELRNPLAPMANALALLERADDNPALRSRTREIMTRQVAQMVRLIDDLMDVARITQGKIDLRLAPVDVVAVARSALEAADPALRRKQHRVETVFPEQAACVQGDAARLTQVLVNLLHNAARYTDPGGHVLLSVCVAGGTVQLAVQDNGIGIAPEDHPAVFDMFVQLDKSLERGAAGLGIGLTIARQLIALHGGTLTLASAGKGQGATFTVSLPLGAAPAEAAAAGLAQDAPSPGAGRSVLIADDNVDFACSLAELVRAAGHRVVVVHDGAAAVAAMAQHPPDVAFVDIGMPVLNGYEVARQVLAGSVNPPRPAGGRRVPVLVAITGWGQAADRQLARDAGYQHHWTKPVEPRQVLEFLAAPPPASGSDAEN